MSQPTKKSKTAQTASTIHSGKFYVLKKDIWAIDTLNPDFYQIYVKDQIFKVKPDALEFLEEKAEE